MNTIRSKGIEKLVSDGELGEEFLSVVSSVARRDFAENGYQAGCRVLELVAHGGIVIHTQPSVLSIWTAAEYRKAKPENLAVL